MLKLASKGKNKVESSDIDVPLSQVKVRALDEQIVVWSMRLDVQSKAFDTVRYNELKAKVQQPRLTWIGEGSREHALG